MSARPLTRYALAAIFGAAAVMLLWTSVPHFLAELALVPGTPAIAKLARGRDVNPDDLALLIDTRQQALGVAPDASSYDELAVGLLQQAQFTGDTTGRRRLALEAAAVLRQALSHAPARVRLWQQLVNAELVAGERTETALANWRRSLELATFDPDLLMARIHQGIILLRLMRPEDLALLAGQVDLAYRWHKGILHRYAVSHGIMSWVIYLLEDPEAKIWMATR
ncbi:MAG: hypothetical protein EP335_15780 [Alphaproteobacteria bacterium]|nr:MAG: hypothetical protein EP335_15780 [Alphaproteobacteria bacterium]